MNDKISPPAPIKWWIRDRCSRRVIGAVLLAVGVAGVVGCGADSPMNPSFLLTYADAKTDTKEMKRNTKSPPRPIVIAGGIHDPGFIAPRIARRIRSMTSSDAEVISVSFFAGSFSFDDCRERLVSKVQQAWPSDDPNETIEVDVIGFSMGGLVARYAAAESNDGAMRLNVRRLFTISTPHQGARLANLPTLDKRVRAMRSGSSFLEELDAALIEAKYELLTYARLGDIIVGAQNAAPGDGNAWWVANPFPSLAHMDAATDVRILADIARRLRGEPPYATSPPAPLPGATDHPTTAEIRQEVD